MKEQLYTIPLNEAVDANDECPFCFVERAIEQDDPTAERFTKPYLIDKFDYERSREYAATLVREV